ncbi:MAG: addiction module toxin RelE [Anaerolineae bacterium]|nr:MAG: addiction module toxin RelE [Anaerolineae bacterium]
MHILTIILVRMTDKRFHLIYDTEFVVQMRSIERKYHSLIRETIEQQLVLEPDVETHNRKQLVRATTFGARWELRFDANNEFRLFYSIYPEKAEVHILAIGIKVRERLYIGGKEVKL